MNVNLQKSRRSHNFSRTTGFTLIEVLITFALFAVVSVLLTQTLFSVLKQSTQTQQTQEFRQAGTLVVNTLEVELRNSESIDTACVDGVTYPSFQYKTQDGDTKIISCDETSGYTAIALSTNGVNDILTPSTVTLGSLSCATSNLAFTCSTLPSGNTNITMSFTLTSRDGTGVSQSFPFSLDINTRQ